MIFEHHMDFEHAASIRTTKSGDEFTFPNPARRTNATRFPANSSGTAITRLLYRTAIISTHRASLNVSYFVLHKPQSDASRLNYPTFKLRFNDLTGQWARRLSELFLSPAKTCFGNGGHPYNPKTVG